MLEMNWIGRILVVDDNIATIDMIKAVLEAENFEIIVATTGEKAIDRAVQSPPDLILLDVVMPGIDGFETSRRLKAKKATRDIPIIFMTALSATRDKIQGFSAGGIDYITKPINIEEILARIKTHIALRKMRERLESRNEALKQEIARRKALEKTLRESEAQKQAILDASIDRIRLVDREMRIIWANRTMAEGVDMSVENLKGQICHQIQHGLNEPCDGCPTVLSRASGKIERAVIRKKTTRGIAGETYWDIYCVPLPDDAGAVRHFMQVERNITYQRRSEEQIQNLSHELIKAQENERLRISHELHDHVAQDLASLKIQMDTFFDGQKNPSETSIGRASDLSERLRKVIVSVRDMAYDLRPPLLDQFGLVKTIAGYCEDFSLASNIDIDFTHDGSVDDRFDFDTEINLYRLVQEGLNNVRKHADARHAAVDLAFTPQSISLTIKDDGKGFDVEQMTGLRRNHKRMGLRNMKERVSLLGGEIRLQSRPAGGTRIFITVPAAPVEKPVSSYPE